jgi:hypothetical protein
MRRRRNFYGSLREEEDNQGKKMTDHDQWARPSNASCRRRERRAPLKAVYRRSLYQGAPIARPLARANRARLRLPVWAWPNKDAFQIFSFSSVVSLFFMSKFLIISTFFYRI